MKDNILNKVRTFFSQFRKFFRGVWRLLTINGLTLLVFEGIYKLLAIVLFKPLLHGIARLLLHANGYAFVTDTNIRELLKNPLFWIFIFIVLVLISLYMLFDISCIVICYHASYHKQRLPLLAMMRRGILAAKNVIYPNNYRMMLYLLLIMPMSQVVTVTGVLGGFSMPRFVMQFIEQRNWLYLIFILASIYVEMVCVQWIFCFQHFVLSGVRFKTATRRSLYLVHDTKLWKNILFMLIWDAVALLAYYGILYTGSALIAVFSSISDEVQLIPVVVESAVAVLLDLVAGVFYCFSIPYVFLGVSALFYFYLEESGKKENIPPKFNLQGAYHIVDKQWFKKLYRRRGVLIAAGLAVILGVHIGYAAVSQSQKNLGVEIKKMLITAHRGYSFAYPENTMPAFEGAVEQKADVIEIDVHLTADGEVAVIHDESFERTTGVDREVWEMDSKEIEALDAGSWFSEEYAGTKIPMLPEVVEFAKEHNIMLMVELKTDPHVDGLAEKVIDILQQYGYAESCMLASLDYTALEDAKAYKENISTIYITTVSYGNLASMEAADGFSIESTFASAKLIKEIHRRGKFVYVWTVNNENEMEAVIKLAPDGIVTDRPQKARGILEQMEAYDYWENYVYRLQDLLKT